MRRRYAVIVIGGGHAGVEAARAASAALGPDGDRRVALVTMDPSTIGTMSCNPAIGGLGKGQMVREIDALGGLMGRAIDATGIMFKMLNTSKGAAVRGPRAQADKHAYRAEVQRLVSEVPRLDVVSAPVDDIVVDGGRVTGVLLPPGAGPVAPDPARVERCLLARERALPIYHAAPRERSGPAEATFIAADAVVLTTGTFMRGLMHTGERRTAGGRAGEGAAIGISATLARLGLELARLKTGTPPRLRRGSIDWDGLERQAGDGAPAPFSDMTPELMPGSRFPRLEQIECRMTATTAAAHDLIRRNLHRAPMYAGNVDAECGPRYCPSIEDKVVRFPGRDAHHVFLEPESLHDDEIYCNGISTSLPEDVQAALVRSMPGCARAEIVRWGYAVEYDVVRPHQIDATGMVKSIPGLFLAGQINGTSGYEEAAGQGLVAGLNAALFAGGTDPVRLGRDQAYIGVMLDDLVTKTPREPYRMFTSRAEHRLLLRADNADERLTPLGRELGLVDDGRWRAWTGRAAALDRVRGRFASERIDGRSLAEHARRPDVTLDEIASRLDGEARSIVERVMVESRYAGYVARQRVEIRRSRESERQRIPEWIHAAPITGLRAEAAEVIARFRPATLGQASRLAGVNPADVTLVALAIRRGAPAALPRGGGNRGDACAT